MRLVFVAAAFAMMAQSPAFAKKPSENTESSSRNLRAIDPAQAKAWRTLSRLEGTFWSGSGDVNSYRWIIPFEKMEIRTARAARDLTEILTLNAEGNGIDGIVVEYGQTSRWSSPRDGIIIQEVPKESARYVYRVEGNHLSWRLEKLTNGQWEWTGKSWDQTKITSAEAAATTAELAAVRLRAEKARLAAEEARRRADAAALRAMTERWKQQTAAINAQIAARQEQSHEDEPQPAMGYNMLDVLNGLGAAVQQQNVQQQQSFERQMQSYNSGSSSSNGAIIIDNTPAPTYTPPSPISQLPTVQPAPSSTGSFAQGQSGSGCSYWHRPRASDREYEQCSPGDENCTCADASTVSQQ